MLAESKLSTSWTLMQILAIAAAEAVAALEARGLHRMNIDTGIRTLRWCLQDIRNEAKNRLKIPGLPPKHDITSCGFKVDIQRGGVIRGNEGWRVVDCDELSTPFITVRASAEQMLWLSQYPNFSSVLHAFEVRFGATQIEIQNFLALESAVAIANFRDTLGGWLEGVDIFIHELERMLVEGVIIPEVC